MYNTVSYEVVDSTAIIAIDRQEVGNALGLETYGEIAQAMHQADEDKAVKAIILTGKGRFFSTGGDVPSFKDIIATGEGLDKDLILGTGRMVKAVKTISKPVISAVNKVAAGAGAGLALAADFVIMGESSQLVTAFINMAFPGDTLLIYNLVNTVGPYAARKHLMLNEPITAQMALDYGLAYQVVADEDLMDAAHKLANRLAKMPGLAIKSQKELIASLDYPGMDVFNSLEADLMFEASKSKDHEEAVNAFLEKRQPNFKGE